MKHNPTSLKSRIIVIALGIALGYLAKAMLPVQLIEQQASPPASSEIEPNN